MQRVRGGCLDCESCDEGVALQDFPPKNGPDTRCRRCHHYHNEETGL